MPTSSPPLIDHHRVPPDPLAPLPPSVPPLPPPPATCT